MMNKRKLALDRIRQEFYENGSIATSIAIRLYVENRISHRAFQQAAKEGLKLRNRNKKGNIASWQRKPLKDLERKD